VHLLSLEHVDQLHLLFESLQKFIPLAFKFLILIRQSIQISTDVLILATLIDFGFPKGELVLLDFLKGPIELGLGAALGLHKLLAISLAGIFLLVGLFQGPLILLDLQVLLVDCRLEFGHLKV
jgi:hypothetical protein